MRAAPGPERESRAKRPVHDLRTLPGRTLSRRRLGSSGSPPAGTSWLTSARYFVCSWDRSPLETTPGSDTSSNCYANGSTHRSSFATELGTPATAHPASQQDYRWHSIAAPHGSSSSSARRKQARPRRSNRDGSRARAGGGADRRLPPATRFRRTRRVRAGGCRARAWICADEGDLLAGSPVGATGARRRLCSCRGASEQLSHWLLRRAVLHRRDRAVPGLDRPEPGTGGAVSLEAPLSSRW